MSETRIRRTERYQTASDSLMDVEKKAGNSQANHVSEDIPIAPIKDFDRSHRRRKGMHWVFAWLLAALFYGIMNSLLGYLYTENFSTLVYRFNVDPHVVFSIFYFAMLLIYFFSRMLWIRLTYKRYSYHNVWRIITLIMIVLSPLTYYLGSRNDLLLANLDSSTIDELITVSHLVISYLITLIPLLYLYFVLKKAKKEPSQCPVHP